MLPEVGVVAVDPILTRGIEDVEVDGVFEGEGFVGYVGWDAEDFAGVDDDFFVFKDELQSAFEDVGDLFVVMAVQRDVRAFFQQDAGDHNTGAYDELAADEWVERFDFDVGPAGECGFGGLGHFCLRSDDHCSTLLSLTGSNSTSIAKFPGTAYAGSGDSLRMASPKKIILEKQGTRYVVRDAASGRFFALKGYGALKGKTAFRKDIDLTKPILEQVTKLTPRRRKTSSKNVAASI